jgi:hypothetical protein
LFETVYVKHEYIIYNNNIETDIIYYIYYILLLITNNRDHTCTYGKISRPCIFLKLNTK